MLEQAEEGGRRQRREVLEEAPAPRSQEVERPRPDGEAERDDRGAGGALGQRRGGDGDPRAEQDPEQVSEEEVQRLWRVEVAAVRDPENEREEPRSPRGEPA